LYKSTKNRIG